MFNVNIRLFETLKKKKTYFTSKKCVFYINLFTHTSIVRIPCASGIDKKCLWKFVKDKHNYLQIINNNVVV